MSLSSDKSPSANFQNNTPDRFRSPHYSPRNGADFSGSSPMKNNFGWRNRSWPNKRFYGHNDQRFNYSPRGARRGGGHFRGGHHRGSHRNDHVDISLYVNPAMLSDPWKELSESLEVRMQSSSVKSALNTSESNDDTLEELTEESVLASDLSADVSDQIADTTEGQTPTKGLECTQ